MGTGGRAAVFNARTGALVSLEGRDVSGLVEALLDPLSRFSGEEFPPDVFARLWRGGQIVDMGYDELGEIRARYWRARGETPVVITITTTMDCNLGCYYCYEERGKESLAGRDVAAVVELARRRVEASGKRALHVDWYGGEPLLNLDFIEAASAALQSFCDAEGHAYVSSIISNGSAWPEDVEEFVARHRIRQVQISFDGLKVNHDKRRHYRREFRKADASSFERAVALVDRLVRCVRVDVRYNIDRANSIDLLDFIRFARRRGWFDALFPAVFQPARLSAYSTSSRFMRQQELPLEEFDQLRAEVRAELEGKAAVEESEVPDGFPYPKTSVCAALADHSIVIGAEGLAYRCGLQVGERRRAVGTISSPPLSGTAPNDLPDVTWWAAFDPTALPSCSTCSFLPICWGGCPKKHLEGDQHAIGEQGRYWRTNLPRMIAKAAGIAELTEDVVPERLQFR
jgi:uncharacterized protein